MITAIGLVTVVVYGLYLSMYLSPPLTGDEVYYYRQVGRFRTIILLLLQWDLAAIPDVFHQIIENGWFIPLTSALLAPASFFGSEPEAVRLIYFTINLILHGLILELMRRNFGLLAMILFHAISLLFPPYMVFMVSLFGEGLASRLLLVIALWLYMILGRERAVSVRETFFLGCLLALTVLLRHNLLLVCPVVALAVLFDTSRKTEGPFPAWLQPGVLRASLLTVVVCGALLPWSLSLSKKFDGPYLTVTTHQIADVWRNATPAFTQERLGTEQPQGNPFWQWSTYYRDLARSTDRSYYELVEADRERLQAILSTDLEHQERLARNRKIARERARGPSEFVLRRLMGPVKDAEPLSMRAQKFYAFVDPLNRWLWKPLLVLGLLAPLLLFGLSRKNRPGQLVIGALLYVNAGTLFLHAAHTRHFALLYPMLIFVVSVAAAMLLQRGQRGRQLVSG
ncbi:MAG: hypothetical protein AAGH19_04530 [Pseudomonadota bacterium]